MRYQGWTEEELALLKRLLKKSRSMKDHAQHFENRSPKALANMAAKLDSGVAPKTGNIRKLMADGQARFASEIAKSVGVKTTYVRDFMRRACLEGDSQEMHVAHWDTKRGTRVYVIGPGINALPPISADRAHRVSSASERLEEMSDEQLDAMYRAKATWWPVADQVVVQAMTAMCAVDRVGA